MSQSDLERRVAALEQQAGQGGGQTTGQQSEGGAGPSDEAMAQAFLQGMMIAYAANQTAQSQSAQGGQQFLGGLFGGWAPTNYDSRIWCKSRFMCNPMSISCLC